MLLLLSNLPERGREVCEWIRQCAPSEAAATVGTVDESPEAAPSSIADSLPADARCIIFVADFALALGIAPPDSEEKLLARRSAWLASARQFVHAATTLRDRVLLLPLPRTDDDADLAIDACQRFASAKFERPTTTRPMAAIDPIIRVLGQYLIEADGEVAATSVDLQVLTKPLARSFDPSREVRDPIVSAVCAYAQATHHAEMSASREALLVTQILQLETELSKRPRHVPTDNVPRELKRMLTPLGLAHVGVRIGKAGGDGSHRHLNFEVVTQKESGREPLPKLSVRLVNHGGNPGLVLFLPTPDSGVPLPDWPTSGEEAGRRFLLVHPRHFKAREQLAAMGWRESLVLAYVCRALRLALESATSTAGDRGRPPPIWRYVAQQLDRDFDALPPIWRARTSRIPQPQTAESSRFAVEYDDVWVGGSIARDVTATAIVDPRGHHVLEVTVRDASRPLLSIAALAADDTSEAVRHSVAFGIAKSRQASLASWAKYADGDLAVLDSLVHSLQMLARAEPAAEPRVAAGLAAMHAELRAARQRRTGTAGWWAKLRAATG